MLKPLLPIISWAAFWDSLSSSWSHSMSTPDLEGTLSALTMPLPTFQAQCMMKARVGSRRVESMETFAPASWRALMKFVTLVLKLPERSARLGLSGYLDWFFLNQSRLLRFLAAIGLSFEVG